MNGPESSATIDWESLAITETPSYFFIAVGLEVIN